MRSLVAACAVLLLLVSGLAAQQAALTPELLKTLEQSCAPDAQLRAAQNAVAQTDPNKVMQNWGTITGVDQFFSLRLKDQKITDQKGTGRCWMFAGLNILRPAASQKLDCEDVEFSQNYLFFYEKLEKANMFLDVITRTKDKPFSDRYVENILKMNVQDGQNWQGFVELINKYGVVPKEVMPETYSSSNSGHVVAVMSLRLKQAAVKIRHASSADAITAVRLQALKDIYRILAINFGLPPKEFQYRYKTKSKGIVILPSMTPQEFCAKTIGSTLEEYCVFYSVPTLAANRKYEIDLDKTVNNESNLFFVNCSLDAMKAMASSSLKDSTSVWFACDVGQQSNWDHGVMGAQVYDYAAFYGIDLSMTRKDLFETYSSIPTHAMVFTGIDIVNGRTVKWLVQNSWGDSKGRSGYYFMLDEWFDSYVQAVVIHRKYVPQDLLAVFKTKAELLPPWDPMNDMLNGR